MGNGIRFLFLMILAGGTCACTLQAPPQRMAAAVPFSAPSTAWAASHDAPIAPSYALAGAEAEAFTARAEKVAWGPLPLGGVTAYTTYTYDAQRISTFSGTGYRYRWVTQTGISMPAGQ